MSVLLGVVLLYIRFSTNAKSTSRLSPSPFPMLICWGPRVACSMKRASPRTRLVVACLIVSHPPPCSAQCRGTYHMLALNFNPREQIL